jgi:hypothetical protein
MLNKYYVFHPNYAPYGITAPQTLRGMMVRVRYTEGSSQTKQLALGFRPNAFPAENLVPSIRLWLQSILWDNCVIQIRNFIPLLL